MTAKQVIKAIARKVGVEVTRYDPLASDHGRLAALLASHKIDLVLDVGANVGQFGEWLRTAGYRGRIVSFEPMSAARTELLRKSSRDPLWDVAERSAIGDHEGEVDIHIAGNSVSSSILPMLSAHADAAPESAYVGTEKTKLSTLDAAAAPYVKPDSVVFLKIDTQGYEDRVLRGATELLKRLTGLQLEMSLVPLYEGQQTFDELRAHLGRYDFEIWSLAPAFIDPHNGRVLQVDTTFFRS